MAKIHVPPIKCQGIKTKLVPLIMANVAFPENGTWIEPFMGTAVVGLNVRPKKALFADVNPYVIAFYNALKSSDMTCQRVRSFLEKEGQNLLRYGDKHYYHIRERFNREKSPLDFLFLSRSCFNGMIRFNRKGEFNVPFCRKPGRFSRSYITKIVNQVEYFQEALRYYDWSFVCQDFQTTISTARKSDFVYCDPPYIGRHVDYYNSWSEEDEYRLCKFLSQTKAQFILSTWHSNKYRSNETLDRIWSGFQVITKEHFYHIGAKQENRNSILEAFVMNFEPPCKKLPDVNTSQLTLFERIPQFVQK